MMTELKLHTYGEKLIVSEKVTIASGDINSAAIAVEFDECWDNYPARTAIFKNDKITGNIEVLMVDNKCTIPAEALQKNGTLKISIRAASIDGAALKTSTKIRYTIAEGASPGTTTLTPTMDLYQQYLKAMEKAVAPAQEALLLRLDEKFEQHATEVNEDYARFKAMLCEVMKPTPIWENPKDDEIDWSVHEEITIPVDLSKYDSFIVLFYDYYGYQASGLVVGEIIGTDIVKKDTTGRIGLRYGVGEKPTSREFVLTDTGATFQPTQWAMSGGTGYGSDYLMPYKIIGFVY